MATTPLAQHIDHVFKILDVSALVGTDGYALHIFLYGRIDDFGNGAVMAKVYYLGTRSLQDTAHDVYRCIVTVKQARGSNKADVRCSVFRLLSRFRIQ